MATSSDHFLALLRFSLGIDREFNFRPTAGEWAQLYEQSLRQSLVGVTYEGVSRLPEDCFEPAVSSGADAQTHLPQLLALQWASDAEVIAGLNDLQNRKAAQLTARFEEQGHRTVIPLSFAERLDSAISTHCCPLDSIHIFASECWCRLPL